MGAAKFKGQKHLEELSVLLKDESPRCTVIVSMAFLDETLARLLGDEVDRSLFARIEDALAWGLLSQHERDDLQCLRQLRNSFAHDLRVKDFDSAMSKRVKGLKLWTTASTRLPKLDRAVPSTLQKVLYVVGVIGFRLQNRLKLSKPGPIPEPPITDTKAWPPVTSF